MIRQYYFKVVFNDQSSIIVGSTGSSFAAAQASARNTMLDLAPGQPFQMHTYQEWGS